MTSDDRLFEIKKIHLFNNLNNFHAIAVALSGGVDSTLLLAAAHHVLGDGAIAITAKSGTHPSGELEMAVALARQMNVRHIVIETDELDDPNFVSNGPDRCYFCKKRFLTAMIGCARQEGVDVLAHGMNLDDMSDYRPGIRAAEELGVVAPLAQAGFLKSDIRRLARQMELPNWNRPAMACLATRVPYGTRIQKEVLSKIDQAEQVVRQLGVGNCRVRDHGNLACIEVDPDEIEILTGGQVRQQIVELLKGLGYQHVSIDMEGYRSGKLNRDLKD